MISFYASVECVERNMNPFETPLAVCDIQQGMGGIVLAITPYLKSLGYKSRCRIIDFSKDIPIIFAKPQMKKYIEYANRVYYCYLSFFSKEDIFVYSIDEAFIDVGPYLKYYQLDILSLGQQLQRTILEKTKLYSSCGCGENLFLAKVALDILAKRNNNRIAYLSTEEFIKEMWHHQPLSDFWRIGRNIQRRLHKLRMYHLKSIALADVEILIKEFGIIGKEIYEHAWGIDLTTIKDIKEYKPKEKSKSIGQILPRKYSYKEAIIVLTEMVDQIALDLVNENLYCRSLFLSVGYSKEIKRSVNRSLSLNQATNSYQELKEIFKNIYFSCVEDYPIKNLRIGVSGLTYTKSKQLSLFDIEEPEKEKKLMESINLLKQQYGKNIVNKGINYTKASTGIERNKKIGGHHE